jgi:hypothetical protein
MGESIEGFIADGLVHNRGSSDAPSPVVEDHASGKITLRILALKPGGYILEADW